MQLQRHPLSAAYPSMDESEFAALVADIKTHGLLEPGIVFDGKVLDGWHRYRACEQAGVKFVTQPFSGRDPVNFVRSRNDRRRHMNASQRAQAEVRLGEWLEHGHRKTESTSAPGSDVGGRTTAEMAELAHVSARTIEQAKAAERAGLGDAVLGGKISAKKAAEVARLPKVKREKAVAAINAGQPVESPKSTKPTELERAHCKIAEMEEALASAREDIERLSAIEAGEQGDLIKRLQAELRAVKAKRDDVLRENVELRRQIKYLERQQPKATA